MAANSAARKKVEELILDTIKTMEPEGTNYERYKKIFSAMSDAQFDTYMKELRDGKRKLTFLAPNMKVVLKHENLFKAAEKVNAEIFSRITYRDPITGIKYTPPDPVTILTLPIRRTRQYLHHGLSVAEGDSRVEVMSGQVTKPDQASKFSFPEMQLLYGRGMTKTITEFMKIRGGDINAYANFKQQLEETGSFSQDTLDPDTMARSVMIAHLTLKVLGLDNNIVEDPTDPEPRQ